MTNIPIVGEKTITQEIDEATADVVELLEMVPLGADQLIGIVELSFLDILSNLAGYVYEMQKQILDVLGAIPEPGAPTADDFAGRYIEDYTLLRISRTRSLLRAHVADLAREETPIDSIDERIHDEHARAREDAVQDALEAEKIVDALRVEGHAVKVVIGDDAERDDGD